MRPVELGSLLGYLIGIALGLYVLYSVLVKPFIESKFPYPKVLLVFIGCGALGLMALFFQFFDSIRDFQTGIRPRNEILTDVGVLLFMDIVFFLPMCWLPLKAIRKLERISTAIPASIASKAHLPVLGEIAWLKQDMVEVHSTLASEGFAILGGEVQLRVISDEFSKYFRNRIPLNSGKEGSLNWETSPRMPKEKWGGYISRVAQESIDKLNILEQEFDVSKLNEMERNRNVNIWYAIDYVTEDEYNSIGDSWSSDS